jgi:ParB family transcriptional regulator, chromosome partitioning protein
MRLIYPAQVKTRTYDSDSQVSTIRELALSIKTHGLLQPIIVRPTNKGFEIVAGHRRFLACKYLRWKKIAVCIKDLSDQEAFEVQIVENLQRCSLNCIEEGQAFNAFVNHYGWGGVTNLANKIMKSEQYISRRIQLLKLPSVIQDYLIDDDISVSQASELLSLNENDRKMMIDRIINEDLSIREIRAIKKDINGDFASNNLLHYIPNKTANFVSNRPTYAIGTTSEDFMNDLSNKEIIRNYSDNNQQLLLLKKVKLCRLSQ